MTPEQREERQKYHEVVVRLGTPIVVMCVSTAFDDPTAPCLLRYTDDPLDSLKRAADRCAKSLIQRNPDISLNDLTAEVVGMLLPPTFEEFEARKANGGRLPSAAQGEA